MRTNRKDWKFLTLSASIASASNVCLTTISWGAPRVDVFGVAPNFTIWHKFYTGHDWQPSETLEYLPALSRSEDGCPSATTWGHGRLDIFYVNRTGSNVLHKYFDGGNWNPSGAYLESEDLGGNGIAAIASNSWGYNRLDIVGRNTNSSYVHKAWTGSGWYPSVSEWEDFGGVFISDPAIVSWDVGRLDIIGISEDATLQHKYYQDGWSEWEKLGEGPFIGNPVATSWGPNRLDIWAIDANGELNHLYWDGSQWSTWENLGGEFTDTPKVVHWNESKIDIVGKGLDDNTFHLKGFDGSQWNPSETGWYDLAGPFESEPGLLAKNGSNFLYIFGIDQDDVLRMQVWTGYGFEPGYNKTWPLGGIVGSPAELNWNPTQPVQKVLQL